LPVGKTHVLSFRKGPAMLNRICNVFTGRDSRRQARLAMARIMTRFDLVRLSFNEGIREERRQRDEHHVALGVWLFPCEARQPTVDVDMSSGMPAVTSDLRAEGFGVMVPTRLTHGAYLVAAPEEEGHWRYFRCTVCHNTAQPGGWYQLGMHVKNMAELTTGQRTAFREYLESVTGVVHAKEPVETN